MKIYLNSFSLVSRTYSKNSWGAFWDCAWIIQSKYYKMIIIIVNDDVIIFFWIYHLQGVFEICSTE